MLDSKGAAGQMANKVLCLSGNILEHLESLFLYLWNIPECNQMCVSKETNLRYGTKAVIIMKTLPTHILPTSIHGIIIPPDTLA